jgi:branched-subunit amino acid ABC-type transport system permease component
MNFWRILVLGLTQGLVFAVAAFPIRMQLSLFNNFDFSIAAAILLASEVFSYVTEVAPGGTEVRILLGSAAGTCAAVILMTTWNSYFDRLTRKRSRGREPNLFVVSLGLSVATAGLVGLVRGPGLRQSDLNDLQRVTFVRGIPSLEYPVAFALFAATGLLITVFLWLRSRPGFSILLLSQDAEFAREIGIERKRLMFPSGIMGGLSAGVVGSYYALSSGSTIELGLTLFLYGAGAALIFSGMRFFVWGGLVLGLLLVWLQQVLAPAWATAVVFFGVVVLVTLRGSSRLRQGVR